MKFKLILIIMFMFMTSFTGIPIVNSSQNDSGFISISADSFQYVDGEVATSYGEVVTGIGDYNVDGFNDFIVGGRQYNDWRGKTWIYFTDEKGIVNKTETFTIIGEPNIRNDGECFGHTAINAGDINNDGVNDFIAGGPGSWGAWDIGKVYIFYGNTDPYPSEAGLHDNGEIVSPNKYDWLGETMSPLKDFNGDGYGDVLIGAPGSFYDDDPLANPFDIGHAYIYYGSENGLSLTPNVTLNDIINDTGFALALNGEGDVNGDGLSDALIGGDYYNNGKGRAYIFYGSETSDINRTPDVIINAPENSITFGLNLAIINDLNNDGFDEIAIKSYSKETYTPSYIALYLGNAEKSYDSPDLIFETGNNRDNFGFSIKGVGDINGDFFNDFAVGAPGEADKNDYEGFVYLFYGSSIIDNKSDMLYIGEKDLDKFGSYIGTIDIFKNGTNSLLISSMGYNKSTGRVYLNILRNNDIDLQKNTSGFEFNLLLSLAACLIIIRKIKLKI